MKVSQMIKLCSQMADLEIPERYQFDDGREALQDQCVQKLLMCCNTVMEQLYCDFATDLGRCDVTAKQGFVDLSSLDFNRVVSLVDSSGNSVRYRYTSGGIAAEDGTYRLTYAKRPSELLWDDEIPLPTPRLTYRIFAYGVIAEYFLSEGDFVAAKAWEIRFDDALASANTKSSHGNLPVRRWFL